MADRTYIVQRFNVAEGPAEPGYSWGAHTSCEEVRLVLHEDGSFRIQLGTYYSDWGEWAQDLVVYEGRYEQQDGGFICRAATKTIDTYFHDHELQQTRIHRESSGCDERFDFPLRSDGVVVCPFDHGDLAGVTMSSNVVPMRNFRKQR